MKIKKPTRADLLNAQAIEAVNNALDATPDRDTCEAWYEAMEAVNSWQYPNHKEEVYEALNFVRDAIDERYS